MTGVKVKLQFQFLKEVNSAAVRRPPAIASEEQKTTTLLCCGCELLALVWSGARRRRRWLVHVALPVARFSKKSRNPFQVFFFLFLRAAAFPYASFGYHAACFYAHSFGLPTNRHSCSSASLLGITFSDPDFHRL